MIDLSESESELIAAILDATELRLPIVLAKKIPASLRAAHAQGRREGAEWMREQAAILAEDLCDEIGYDFAGPIIAPRIRALPMEEPE